MIDRHSPLTWHRGKSRSTALRQFGDDAAKWRHTARAADLWLRTMRTDYLGNRVEGDKPVAVSLKPVHYDLDQFVGIHSGT